MTGSPATFQVSEEFRPNYLQFAREDYLFMLRQYHLLRDRHDGDGTHPDVVKAKRELDRARRMRCEIDPEFAAQQLPQVNAA